VSTVCELQELAVEHAAGEIRLSLRANRFLRGMVCLIVGELLAVAAGRLDVAAVRQALLGQRSFRTVAAPPLGLVLKEVIYPPGEPGPVE
jgi:tRNA pseudouridine38-40 synthase